VIGWLTVSESLTDRCENFPDADFPLRTWSNWRAAAHCVVANH